MVHKNRKGQEPVESTRDGKEKAKLLPPIDEFVDNHFLVIDKPPGIISHEVSSFFAKLFGVKAGHTGTLDPDVSGVLIVGLGKAVKLQQYIMEQGKTYVGIVKFPEEKSKEEVLSIFKSLTGVIEQVPPKESAVVRRKRKRHVYSLDLLELKGQRALFKTHVERGTYIRVLCEQMGGYMEDLRRIETAGIHESKAVIMQRVLDAYVSYKCGNEKPLQSLLWTPEKLFLESRIPKVFVDEKAAKAIASGAPLYAPGVERVEGDVKKGKWIAISYEGEERKQEKGQQRPKEMTRRKSIELIAVLKAVTDYEGQKRGIIAKKGRVHGHVHKHI